MAIWFALFFIGIFFLYYYLFLPFKKIIRNGISEEKIFSIKVNPHDNKIKYILFCFFKMFFLSIITYLLFAYGFYNMFENYILSVYQEEFYQLLTGILLICFLIAYTILLIIQTLRIK